jgi:Carboxypeptidase regulatory-like domain
MMILKSTWLLLLSTAAAICADSGSLTGKILTAAGAGAPVPKALVEAKNLATQASQMIRSAFDGSYELSDLPPGDYEISVGDVPFFLPFHQRGVQVAAGKITLVDIRLNDITLNTLGDGGVEFAHTLADNPAPLGPTPRAGDGKPDLSGVWQGSLPSTIGEAPELLPSAEAIAKQWKVSNKLPPTTLCLPGGIATVSITEYQLAQTPNLVVIVDGGFNPTRLIYLDGREHPRDFNPSWMGHSIGRWEGDTLVVDTVGFNELGRLGVSLGGLSQDAPRTEKLHVTERLRRPDLGHLEVETTYDDPGAFKKPFKTRYVKALAPKDEEILVTGHLQAFDEILPTPIRPMRSARRAHCL